MAFVISFLLMVLAVLAAFYIAPKLGLSGN
jgi:hypothetical protein